MVLDPSRAGLFIFEPNFCRACRWPNTGRCWRPVYIRSHGIRSHGIIHYNDVIMGAMASHITSLAIVYSTVYSGADQRKHHSSAILAFVRGIHRCWVNSPHKRLGNQVKAQPPFKVRLADWPRTPFGVCANLLRDRCSCRSYNLKV